MRNYFSKLGTQVPWRTSQSRGATLALPLRYLSALFLLLTFSIGQSWAADEVVVIGSQSSGALTIATNTHSVAGISGGTNTGTITDASDGQSVSGGSKMGGTSEIGSKLVTKSKQHIRFTVVAGETVRFYYYQTGGANKSSTFATSDFSQSAEYYHAATAYNAAAKNTLYFVDFVFADAGTYAISLTTGQSVYMAALKFTAPAAAHTITYKAGDGSGSDVVDSDAKTVKAFADCSFTAPSGYEFKEWQDGSSNVVAAGATVSADMTLTAIYRLIPTKYTVTYNLNGASGDAPTETSKAEGDAFNLAAAPSWAGHAFDGWLCSADEAVKAAGSSYTMTAANTTFTAQWHEVDCKIYSLTGGIGSAVVQQANATVNDGVSLILSNSDGIIKLSPASGSFNAGDIVTISGTVGNTTKEFGVKISSAADKKATLGTASVAGTTNPMVATATLSAASDYLYICRTGGTTQTILTCEVHRACAEGTAAGLGYAEAEVNKTEGDAAFTNPLTNANSLVLDGYKSSNEEVATVNFSTGEVTIVGAGSATITANSAVQTKAGTLYAAGSASYALTVAALPKYTVTYDLNGGSGSPSEVDHKAGEKFNLHDGVTGITAPTNKTFVNWKDQDDALFDGGAEYTMPAKNVTLTAQWAGDVYTVKFMDGETVLDTKVVEVGSNPTDIEHPTKPLFVFAAWQKEDVDIALDDESWASIAKDAEIILTVRWAKAYANSVDFVKKITDDGTSGWAAYLEANNYYIASTTGVSFDNTNAFDTGLKMKTTIGNTLSFSAAAGKVIDLTVGNISGMTIAINGGEASAITSGTDATHLGVSHYYAVGDQEVVLTETVAGYNIIRQITIRDPYEVSYDPDGGDPVSAQYGEPSVTLPLPVKGTESFLGWFDGETKVGEAGESYTPTANITLKAHWEAVSTDARLASITFSSDAGTLSPAFDPEVTNYTYTMPYGTAAVPTITSATKANPAAKDPVIDAQAAAWGETAHVHGVAASDDTKDYYVQMLRAPKDGVEIIGAVVSSNTDAVVTGLYKGTASVNLKDKKIDKGDYYIYVTLKEGQTFQNGDVLVVDVNTKSGIGTSALEISTGKDNLENGILTSVAVDDYSTGENTIVLASVPSGATSIGLKRSDNLNAKINGLKVYRPMNPVLTAIKFNDTDVEVASTTVAATLPNGTKLGSMTVDPTIWWNGAGTAVAANAWEWDVPNTYTVTDKDGDATVYTITLTEDVLKHTVSFNTHGGSTIDPVQVVDGQKLAAAPADPEKEDYIFQGWAETEDGDIVDVTYFTISADKEFHAIWASDGAIKLLDGATVNHTNFITGVTADETVEFMGNTVNYAKFSGTVSGVNGVKDLTRVIAYNATTNKTKIRISAHNNSTSARTILVKGLVEGASAAEDLASIALGNKEDVVSDWIEFDNATNRTIYIMVSSSAGDVYFTQVKVIESGETPMKQVGEVGYSLNFNKGRAFGKADDDVVFEGLNIELIGDYTALNSGYLKMNSSSMSFTLTNPATLHVTASNNKTYYVSNSASGTDNETAKTGVSEFSLSAGTWYINAGENDVQFTEIEFAEPKCAEPVIDAQPLSKVDYLSGAMSTSVTAHAADGSTLSYQWYNADGEVEVVGANAATLNTTDPGTYYVVITATKTGFQSASIQSENATLKYRKADDATLIALTYGAENTAIALVDGVTDYRVTLPEDATVVPALTATPTMKAYGATADVTDADAFVANEAVSTVLVTAEDGDTKQEYTVTFVVKHDLDKAEDVTGSTTWNWDGVADGEVKIVAAEHGIVLANYIDAANFEKLEGQDNARAYRSNSYPAYQGTYLKFHTTVPGRLTINARYASGADLIINGKKLADLTGSRKDYTTIVFTGDVVITSSTGEYRIYNMTFEKLTVDYTRPVTSGRYGTICLPNGGLMGCAALYEVAYFDAGSQKIYFDEILDGVMEAGVPYIFLPNAGAEELQVLYTDGLNAPAGHKNGLYGSYTQEELTPNDGNYVLLNNQYLFVNSDNVYVGENRAYIRLNEISTKATPLAPGRRRIAMGVQNSQVATGMENLNAGEAPMKVMINGQLFILRGENMFDATGRLVK